MSVACYAVMQVPVPMVQAPTPPWWMDACPACGRAASLVGCVPIGAGMVQFARGVRSGVITRVGSPDGISVCAVHVLSDHQIIPWSVYHFRVGVRV